MSLLDVTNDQGGIFDKVANEGINTHRTFGNTSLNKEFSTFRML